MFSPSAKEDIDQRCKESKLINYLFALNWRARISNEMTLKYSHFLHEDYYGQCVYEYTKNEGLSEGCNTFYYKTGGREQQDTSFIEYF